MKKEIKFRAHEKSAGWYSEKFVMDNLNELTQDENVTVQQFTGLKDKLGKYLYVGDLFKHETNDLIYRVWDVDGGYGINTHVTEWQDDIRLDYPFPLMPLSDEQTVSWFESSCIIIGNIHDNPDLLNPKTS